MNSIARSNANSQRTLGNLICKAGRNNKNIKVGKVDIKIPITPNTDKVLSCFDFALNEAR